MFFQILGDLSGLDDLFNAIKAIIIIGIVIFAIIVIAIYVLESKIVNDTSILRYGKENNLAWIPVLHRFYLVELSTHVIFSIIYTGFTTFVLLTCILDIIKNLGTMSVGVSIASFVSIYTIIGLVDLIFYFILLIRYYNDKNKVIEQKEVNNQIQNNNQSSI